MNFEERWLCSGFLEKESKGDNWNRRFFVLDNVSLKYYKKKPTQCDDAASEGERCRGEIRIKKMVQVMPSASNAKQFCFEVQMISGPPILLVAANHIDMEDWIDNIVTHPLFNAHGNSSSKEPEELLSTPTAGHGFSTKVVGGVVIRTKIQRQADDQRQPNLRTYFTELGVAPSASAENFSTRATLTATFSTASLAGWGSMGALNTAGTSRALRRDGARVIKVGFCIKQGGRRRTWKRRFFVLDPFGLAYFRCRNDKDPLRNVPLPDLIAVAECNSVPDRINVLQVITIGRIFYMEAESAAECRHWIEAIATVVPKRSDHMIGMEDSLSGTDTCTHSRKSSISSECSLRSKGRQLWKLSMGRCRDYLHPMSDDSDDDDDDDAGLLDPMGALTIPFRRRPSSGH